MTEPLNSDCQLCRLISDAALSGTSRGDSSYRDRDVIITKCPVCNRPIVVFKEHQASLLTEQAEQVKATVREIFGSDSKLITTQCSLGHDHCHAHVVKEEVALKEDAEPKTVTIVKQAIRSLGVADFVPYELDDLGVIVPHCSIHPKRWAWFWPNYVAVTHPTVLKNTLVVYHSCGEGQLEVPPDVSIVERTSSLAVIERMGESIAWSTQLGLERNRCRIIARVANDVRFRNSTWAQDALAEFNKEPHFKILAKIVASPDGGPPYEKLKKICYAPWMDRLLRHGDYDRLPFICGQVVIMNRPLWLGYYSLVSEYTLFEREDIYLSLFARADGVPVVDYTSQFHHCGIRGTDEICESGGT